MEFYHKQLKLRLLNEKDECVYQRADWLVNKLSTKVHSYFWLDEYSGKEDFARYWKDEWMSGPTAWRRSLKISDARVVMDGRCAKVTSLNDDDTAHLVRNPGSEYAVCDCSWAKMGNLCEHVFKMIKFCRDKGSVTPSITMYQYSQALINMLHCPPFDSLVRDQAVSLAIWVQMQLNVQFGPHSSQDKGNTVEQQTPEPSMDSTDKVLDNVNHCPGKDTLYQAENQSMVKRRRTDCADMEVDSSITSANKLLSTNGNSLIGLFVENEADLMDGDSTKNLPSTEKSKSVDSTESLEKDHCLSEEEVEPQSIGNLPSVDNSGEPQSNTRETSASKSDTGTKISSIGASADGLIDLPTV